MQSAQNSYVQINKDALGGLLVSILATGPQG